MKDAKRIFLVGLFVGSAAGAATSSTVKDLESARASIDSEKAAAKQEAVVDKASKAQCDALKSDEAKTPKIGDKDAIRAHDAFIDELLRLTDTLNDVLDDGSAIETCFHSYYADHREKIDARLNKMPADSKKSLRQALDDYEDALKHPDEPSAK